MKKGRIPVSCRLPDEVRLLVSPPVAQRFGVIPVAKEGGVAVLVSGQPLAAEQTLGLQFALGSQDFRMAALDEYPEFRKHFDAVLAHYFPPLPEHWSDRDCCASDRPRGGEQRNAGR